MVIETMDPPIITIDKYLEFVASLERPDVERYFHL